MLLAQKKPGPHPEVIKRATRLFSGLADLDFESGAYHSEEIYSKYIVRVAGKGFTVVNHLSEVYGLPDTHECIDENLPLHLVQNIDARQKPNPMNLSSNTDKCSWHIVYPYACFIDYRDLRGFVKKIADRVGKLYSEFIDLGLYKSRFSLRLLGSAKEDRVKRPAISSIKEGYCKLKDYLVQPKLDASEIWPRTFSSEKLEKEEFQPIEDKTALSMRAGLVTAKFGWLEIGSIKKGFVNFQMKSYEACSICEIKHEKDQLYGFLRSNRCFILKCYWQKQYKPDHKGLAFGKVTKISAKPKRGIVKRIGDAISNPRPLIELSEMMINVEKLKDAPEVYPDFLGIEKTTTLIRSSPGTWKTTALREIIMALKDKVHDIFSLPCYIWISYQKSFSNESKSKLNELKASGFRICNYQNMQGDLSINEWDIIIVQVESLFCIEFSVRPFVAILDEANTIMHQMSSSTNAWESENTMRDVLRSVRHVLAMDAFANKSTLAFLKIYRGEDIHIIDNRYQPRVAYTNTVEAGISFEVTDHFDIVIAITNITTPVHVEALAQMLYQIRDCSRRIVSLFYQKNSNELFCPPGHENIWAELTSAWPNNLPTAIKGHYDWNNNTISYKVDESLAVITFIEVEHQKHLSARYFIEKLCSLIASTGAFLQLIKIDESQGVIGNRKRIRNEVRVEALVIKETDYNAVATSWNLSLEEAERHFLRLSYFRRQGHDEENAIKGLKAEENIQWEIACYKAEENLKKSVAEDLRKSYSANHWKVIQELFQILGFTGIDDKYILSGSMVSEAFTQSCERFIEIRNQSLSLFGFKSHAKTTPDLNLAIKAINAIAGNWCGYTIKSDKKRIGPKGQQV
ncbi:hypothetical protein RclHR1_28460001 [Rhizophagus clarus]|uniref:Replication origin-binding protein domain-containing protein n=1 Tax=Rhizophagus clarus TaxID=94130 RepID=A0A2Z6R466_9GLOM|nr:hypothetical protein RclHR1_28460001 [Rhizophagus clarus]